MEENIENGWKAILLQRKNPILLILMLFGVIFVGLMLFNVIFRHSFFWHSYKYFVYVGLVLAILYLFIQKYPQSKYLKPIMYILFLPLAILPILKCWFKVPYIFCNSCPRKCPWGVMRKFFIPVFLGINLDKGSWCFKHCPLGMIQDKQGQCVNKRIHLPRWLRYIRYLFLAFTLFIVIASLIQEQKGFFFARSYSFVLGTAIAAGIIFILAFFIPRLWCNYFCPIGTVGDLGLKNNIVKFILGVSAAIFLAAAILQFI